MIGAGVSPDASLLGQRVSPIVNEALPNLAQGVGKSYSAAIQSSQGHNINKQVHFHYDVTQGADTKTPFYDAAPPQGEFIFGRDSVRRLTTGSAVTTERSDPFVPIMEARGAFAWNAYFSSPTHWFGSRKEAWAFGLTLKYLGTLTAFDKDASMATMCVSRNAFNVINHWAPNIEPGMLAWFHLECIPKPGGNFMLRLQPYTTRKRGPLQLVYTGLDDVPVMTYKVGNALASDEIAYGAFDRVERLHEFGAGSLVQPGMPTKMLKQGFSKASDNWVTGDDLSFHNYTNALESKPRIPMFAVRGSIWGSTS